MRVLLSIMTCHKHAERDAAIRETWLPLVNQFNGNVDAVFVRGGNTTVRSKDVLEFACSDEYHKVSTKFYHTVRFALEQDYDFIIQVDNDTFLMPLPLYIGYLTQHHCVGFVRHGDFYLRGNKQIPYPHGGCFSLSRPAMEAYEKLDDMPWAHDMATGQALHAAGIALTHTDRIKTAEGLGWPQDNNAIISSHWIKPVRMRDIMRYNAGRIHANL